MNMAPSDVADLEKNILRNFFKKVILIEPLDNTVSNSKIVREVKNQLKVALHNSTHRCTCAKRTWGGPCEVCQASDNELVILRNAWRVIRNAKKHNMIPADLKEFLENAKGSLSNSPN